MLSLSWLLSVVVPSKAAGKRSLKVKEGKVMFNLATLRRKGFVTVRFLSC
jgi:hypothetical protein